MSIAKLREIYQEIYGLNGSDLKEVVNNELKNDLSDLITDKRRYALYDPYKKEKESDKNIDKNTDKNINKNKSIEVSLNKARRESQRPTDPIDRIDLINAPKTQAKRM
jgi:hypothetical protein